MVEMIEKIPTKEELRHNRPKCMWELARKYSKQVVAASEEGNLTDDHKYMIDLCAEHLGLPISRMMEVLTDHMSQFERFLSSCSNVELAVSEAEDLFIEQYLAEPENDEKEPIHWLQRKILSQIRKGLGKKEEEQLELVEIAISLLPGPFCLWESKEVTNKHGRKVPVIGQKESRELDERVRSAE